MIKNIIFDIGMVLVDFRYRDYIKDLGFDEEMTERICKAMPENNTWDKLDRGDLELNEVIELFKLQNPDLSDAIDLFWKDISDIVRPFPNTRKWLSDLKDRGYKIYLLSNYPKEMFQTHWSSVFNFTDLVDGKVISSHINRMKPEKEIYMKLLSDYELNPDECVFLDDRIKNTNAAQELGIRTITVSDQSSAIVELDKLLENNR